ncbi:MULTISPECIES: glycine zipper family protein [unclassified Methylomonas]|uniref:glycine zipper family protein n=1 Tax=unclassified Methylomonas TaxID=2608980 RepID=UPI0003804FA9|nr:MULTISPECIES: glycine zipper family protein [unclassified Methylomonas]
MKKLTVCSVTAACLLLSACASQTGWTPTVDTYNNQNSYRLNQDMHECQQLASQASGGTAKETAIGAGVGGLIGAAGGAALGAVLGSPGKGAAIGAAAGGIGGASKQGIQSEDRYKNAYNNCLRQRGHRVVN